MAGGPDLGAIMRQAQQMQKEMKRIQEELAERIVTGTAGGGMVQVLVNGQQEVMKIELNPEAVDPEDVEMLEDLICAAVNEGMKKAKELAEKEIQKATGGMIPPGLM